MNTKKIYKRIFEMLLIVTLLSANCFATTINDVDTSTFMTKAEFDSLKSAFQTQLDTYNLTIENKIDTAISNYLAGIKAEKEEDVLTATSLITYPLKFQMNNNIYDWTKWSENGATPYWAPDYGVYFWGRRSSCTMLIDKSFSTPVINRTFYNGIYSGDKYKINGMIKNVNGKLDINCCFYQLEWQYGNEARITFGFTLDQSATAAREESSARTITRTLVRRSGTTNINFYSGSSTYPLIVDSVWDWGGSNPLTVQSSSTSNENYLNQIKTYGWGTYEGYTPEGTVFFDSSLFYDSYNSIDFIMNQYDTNRTDTSGKRIELPVAYDGHIYLTNKNNFKSDLQNATLMNAQYWDGMYTPNHAWADRTKTYSTTWRFSNIITPGWTLEPQFSGYSSSGINTRSFMEPHNMYYDVVTPYNKHTYEQKMTDGVLLAETNSDYKWVNIKLNIASENSGVKKYLVLSKDPISQSDYTQIDTEAAASIDKYYKISTSKNMTNPVYKYELSEGDNSIYIGEIDKNKLIYYKILWDTNDNTYTDLTAVPTLRGMLSE